MAEAQVKLDMLQFKACLNDEGGSVLRDIQADIQAAETVGVTGTPSIYIKVANTEKWYKVTGTVAQLQTALAGLDATG